MKAFLFILLAVTAFAGWPSNTVPYYHTADENGVLGRMGHWRLLGIEVFEVDNTGSMRPVINDDDLIAYRPLLPGEAIPALGSIVGTKGKDARLHQVVEVSKDGKSFYMSGVNNRYSDGWKKREDIAGMVVEIITRRPVTVATK